jgi:SAM-dependent methyltransferase
MESWNGYCPVCQEHTIFKSYGNWHRDSLICDKCHPNPRERALMYVISKNCSAISELVIHESSPAERKITEQLKSLSLKYIPSQYFQSELKEIDGFLNIDLENQNLPSNSIDLFVCLDVMEHVFDPKKAFQEIFRTLKPGGLAIMTFPITKGQVLATIPRAIFLDNVTTHLMEPIFHGNPIDPNGSLVTIDYGYDIHEEIAKWTNFSVEIVRFHKPEIGVIGEYTEVVICSKTKLV